MSDIPKIVSVDFDGTIVEDRHPKIGCLQPGADDVIRKLRQAGYYVILNTCRGRNELLEAINFCAKEGIYFDRINDNHPALNEKFYPTRKIFADYYIDDRNLGGFLGWQHVADMLLHR